MNYGDELPTDRNFVETRCRLPYGGELKNDNTLSSTYTVRAGFNYFKRLHEVHEIDVNVGTEARSVKYDGISTVQRDIYRIEVRSLLLLMQQNGLYITNG